MEDHRQNLLELLFDSFYSAVDRLRAGRCRPECDAILLGSLIKQTKTIDLLQPRKHKPFHGVSVAGVEKEIAGLSTPTWYHSSEVDVEIEYDTYSFPGKGYSYKKKFKKKKKKPIEEKYPEFNETSSETEIKEQQGHPCTLGELFRHVEDLQAGVQGLELKEILG